jgi:AcrR family transcriptional regulator
VSLAAPVRDDTRARILQVALELIAEHGFASTSTRELAERLGFTKAALYYHFRTKDDLLAALVAPALEGLAALVGEAPVHRSPMARRAVLVAYIDLVTAHEDLIRVLSQDPSVKHRPAQAASGPLYERLTAMLSGDENPDTAQQARVRVALGGIHAALLHAAADDDSTVVREATLMAACGALGISRHRRT